MRSLETDFLKQYFFFSVVFVPDNSGVPSHAKIGGGMISFDPASVPMIKIISKSSLSNVFGHIKTVWAMFQKRVLKKQFGR